MKLGFVGLGKMGHHMASRLLEKGHQCVVFDRDIAVVETLAKAGAVSVQSYADLIRQLEVPRTLWLMVPHHAVDAVLLEVLPHMAPGDTIIDGGNSKYTESMRRAEECRARGVHFIDAGISGGPHGARTGACIMAGGEEAVVHAHDALFIDLAAEDAYRYVGASGAGHFAKMVHNGIEYGMMQAIAEGFAVLKECNFDFDLGELARLYNERSVIESRLVGWLAAAYALHGKELEGISGSVGHSGEGEWTVEEAARLGIAPLDVIEASLEFRKNSKDAPSYRGQILSALRNQFGGHDVSQ
jgi:6-phosphogluconate dehydrogenase